MIRDIVERSTTPPTLPSSCPSPNAPTLPIAPSFPNAGPSTGFPAATHRSQRSSTSAFARSRAQAAEVQSGRLIHGQGRVVESVPSVSSTTTLGAKDVVEAGKGARSSKGDGDGFETLGARRIGGSGISIGAEVDAENKRKVEGMSKAERDQEIMELEEMFGSSLLAKIKARAQARLDVGGNGSGIGSGKGVDNGGFIPTVNSDSQRGDVLKNTPSPSIQPISYQPTASITEAPSTISRDAYIEEDETIQAFFKDTDIRGEQAKLEWLRPLTTTTSSLSSTNTTTSPASTSEIRFDLSGHIIPTTSLSTLPVHLGLHHHGQSPDLAGYSLSEILHLSLSTVASQRILMLSVLAHIVIAYRREELDEIAREQFRKLKAMEKGLKMGMDVVLAGTRNIGIIRAAVEVMDAVLSVVWLPTETGKDGGEGDESERLGDVVERFKSDKMVDDVPFDRLGPKLLELISLDILPHSSVIQIVRIFQRYTLSLAHCEAIGRLVPTLFLHVLHSSPNPVSSTPATTITTSMTPSGLLVETFHLILATTLSSRSSSELLTSEGIPDSMLRYLTPSFLISTPELASIILQIYSALAGYGLGAGLATSARDIWIGLGQILVQNNSGQKVLEEQWRQKILTFWLNLMASWITCGIDPHRTTPEHSLTWTQVEAMGWVDDALSILRYELNFSSPLQTVSQVTETIKSDTFDPSNIRTITAAFSTILAYVEGITINGVRHGQSERRRIVTELKEMKVEEWLPSSVSKIPVDKVGRRRFVDLLVVVFRLHNALSHIYDGVEGDIEPPRVSTVRFAEPMESPTSSAANTNSSASASLDTTALPRLLTAPILDRLSFWAIFTTSTLSSDRALRHAVLEASRESGLLSVEEWGASALDLILSFDVGDEGMALGLMDHLLSCDWIQGQGRLEHDEKHDKNRLNQSIVKAVSKGSEGIGHPDGLQILRPLFHHAILPEIESIVGQTKRSHLYLKATASLRLPPPPPDSIDTAISDTLHSSIPGQVSKDVDSEPTYTGLPLRPDWVYIPLNELLRSASSQAIAQAPVDWNPSETQLVRATLTLARLVGHLKPVGGEAKDLGIGAGGRSATLLGLMKVYMLEHGQVGGGGGGMAGWGSGVGDGEVFRDDVVEREMKALMEGLSWGRVTALRKASESEEQVGKDGEVIASNTVPSSTDAISPTITLSVTSKAKFGPLEKISKPFLGSVPFFQFYTDLVSLYTSISFSDPTFGRCLLPPLSMSYAADYRRLIWVDHGASGGGGGGGSTGGAVVRTLRIGLEDVPVENVDEEGEGKGGLMSYFEPRETDEDVLVAQARALVSGWLGAEGEGRFLRKVAIHHLAGLLWGGPKQTGQDSAAESTETANAQNSVTQSAIQPKTQQHKPSTRDLILAMLLSGPDEPLVNVLDHDLGEPIGGQTPGGAERERRKGLISALGGRAAERVRGL